MNWPDDPEFRTTLTRLWEFREEHCILMNEECSGNTICACTGLEEMLESNLVAAEWHASTEQLAF